MLIVKAQTICVKNVRGALMSGAALAACAALSGAAYAQEEGAETKAYYIPPSEIGSALQTYSEQADVEIIYAEQDVEGKTTNGVDGSYSREAALEEIIEDADLTYEINDDGVVVIRSSFLDLKQASARQPEVRVARASFSAEAQDADLIGGNADDLSYGDEDNDSYSDVVIVTGTNIRGIAPESSPVRSFSREDIQITGAATAQDFIQTLPQNFGGGSNADTALGLPNDLNSAFNGGGAGTIGSSVNLRGLGSGSTLVLLNGRRLAPSSGIGDFVDISLIPASAIERVDVLTDGASSIYGADAVAGVVNFVLRRDFEGVEASYRYGTVTEGGLAENRASISGGVKWDSGNALIAYEYFKQGNLETADRSFSQNAEVPNDLLPSQKRHSVLASLNQEIRTDLEMFADFSFSRRESEKSFTDISNSVFLFGPSSENLNISAGVSWGVSNTWVIDLSGSYSDVHSEPLQLEDGGVTALREIDSDIWSIDAKASGALFELPAGDVKLAIGGQFRAEGFTNADVLDGEVDREADRDVYAVFGEAFIPIVGPDNAMLGIERLEINVSGRFEDFSDFGSSANPKVGVLWSPVDGLRFRGSYSTSFNPPPLGRVGATDLTVAAFRSSFLNFIFGLTPADPSIADVVTLLVSGTADDLDAENSRTFTAGLDYSVQNGPHEVVFSANWFDIDFENRLGSTPVPGNRLQADAPNIAFNNPELFPQGAVIFMPSQAAINALLDSADTFFGLEDPLDAEIINSVTLVRNLARTSVRGFDFDVSYGVEAEIGNFWLGVNGTYLTDFQQQAVDATPLVEQVSTLFNPVDLRLRGRVGYSNGGLAANVFVNYTDSYNFDSSEDSEVVESWTTVDVSLSYDTQEIFNNSFLNNSILRLSVNNLFDQDPPAAPSNPSFGIFGFDPTNASPLNRFIAFELTKQF